MATPALHGLSVLLVEDDRDARDFVRALLTGQGAVVTVAASGAEALRAFTSERPHVIVSDIGMPGMDGFQLLAEVRRLEEARGWGLTPALALTAYGEVHEIVHAGRVGFQRHLGKPCDPARLLRAVVDLGEHAARG
jgi:CheY-like chemotaxis protein